MYDAKEKCNEIAQRLKQLCDMRGVTPYKIAKKAGLSSSTVSCFLAGKSMPRVDTMLILCNQLEISISEFFEEREKLDLQSDEEKKIIETYRNLSMQRKKLLQIYLEMLLYYEEKKRS